MRGQLLQRPFAEVARVVARPDRLARARERGTCRLDRESGRLTGQSLIAGELVHGRQVAELHRVRKSRSQDLAVHSIAGAPLRAHAGSAPSAAHDFGAALAAAFCVALVEGATPVEAAGRAVLVAAQ